MSCEVNTQHQLLLHQRIISSSTESKSSSYLLVIFPQLMKTVNIWCNCQLRDLGFNVKFYANNVHKFSCTRKVTAKFDKEWGRQKSANDKKLRWHHVKLQKDQDRSRCLYQVLNFYPALWEIDSFNTRATLHIIYLW